MRIVERNYKPRVGPYTSGLDNIPGDMFAHCAGKGFDRWIDSVSGSARSNGLNEDGIVYCFPYVIESLYRDWKYSERNLEITTFTDTTHVRASGLREGTNDYYNYAIYHNVTTDFKTYVSDFTGATKEMVLAAADTSGQVGDFIYLTNIKGDDKIDYASFDVLGNTTNGLRKDWICRLSINSETPLEQIINDLCYESHCTILKSYDQIRMLALDVTGESVDTWTAPLISGDYISNFLLTPLNQVYTDYTLKYHYDYARNDYMKEYTVTKDSYSSGLSNGATLQSLCSDVYTNYKIENKYYYESKYITDDDTADAFLNKIVNWFSRQRGLVTWYGGVKTYMKYEIGDQVILNNTSIIPTGINNTSKFMIKEKIVYPIPGAPQIKFTLLEMG